MEPQGKKRTLFKKLSFDVPPGAVVGVVGRNGSGKTTLFKILTSLGKSLSEIPRDELKLQYEGNIRVGESVKVGYITQYRDSLDDENTIYQEIAGSDEREIESGDKLLTIRQFVANFRFIGSDQQKKIKFLSGGERNRVHLAKMIKSAPNLLLLDEPTNDLDIEVLRNLENALADYLGSAIVISHDRWFLDRICTHILAFESNDSYQQALDSSEDTQEIPQSEVIFFEGNYSEYIQDKKKRRGEPKRFKYIKLGM